LSFAGGAVFELWESALLAERDFYIEYISIPAVTATYGSALTAGHFCQTTQK
jgi:hypothetical protein